jgi:hypothetical protein
MTAHVWYGLIITAVLTALILPCIPERRDNMHDPNRLRDEDDDRFAYDPSELKTCDECGERCENCVCDGHGE